MRCAAEIVVGVVLIRLFVRNSRSLKAKRRVVRSVKDNLRQKFNVAVAEVGAQNNRQIAELGLATVSWDRSVVEGTMEAVRSYLERQPQAALSALEWEFF